MDVLTFLAEHAGEVVSKDDITNAVWTDQFITDSVVTRAIAALRRALEDDAHNPRYIETISKRGYRLIAPTSAAVEAPAAPAPPIEPSRPRSSPASSRPFVVRTVGPAAVCSMAGKPRSPRSWTVTRNWLWLLGARRIGKTSLLKQLEHLTASSPEIGYFPLFWDLQGTESPEELHQDFSDALLDAEERLGRGGYRARRGRRGRSLHLLRTSAPQAPVERAQAAPTVRRGRGADPAQPQGPCLVAQASPGDAVAGRYPLGSGLEHQALGPDGAEGGTLPPSSMGSPRRSISTSCATTKRGS